MIVERDDNTHTYSINGNIAMLSFTELLHKHKLAPNYSGVNGAVLNESAEFGRTIHEDIENIINKAFYEPKTMFGKTFAEWAKKNIDSAVAELKMGIIYKNYFIGGTADMIGFLKGNIAFIADNKITAKKDIEYWSWQISLENYALKKLGKEKLNGKTINWKGAEKIFVLWFDKKTGKLQKNKVVELELIPDTEIERLLDCELDGKIYERKELLIDNDTANNFELIELKTLEIENQLSQLKKQADTYRTELLQLFKQQGIISWESPNKKFKITYVPETEQMKVDSNKLKNEFSQIYMQVVKPVKRSEYLLIKERKND